MPTYIIGDIHITGPAAYQAHVPRIARFGGRIVAGGSRIDLLEGQPMPEQMFIIEFPNVNAARRWYQSDDWIFRPLYLAAPSGHRGRGRIVA